jgi:hypothetical protein
MSENERNDQPRRDADVDERAPSPAPAPAPARTPKDPPETTRRPAPGIEHEPEPDGENLIPAKDRPGTL